jgi:hypothetical protein
VIAKTPNQPTPDPNGSGSAGGKGTPDLTPPPVVVEPVAVQLPQLPTLQAPVIPQISVPQPAQQAVDDAIAAANQTVADRIDEMNARLKSLGLSNDG